MLLAHSLGNAEWDREVYKERLKHDLEKLGPVTYGDPHWMDRKLVDCHPSAKDVVKVVRFSPEERLVVGFTDTLPSIEVCMNCAAGYAAVR
jgi:hypothetical protein